MLWLPLRQQRLGQRLLLARGGPALRQAVRAGL